jgi:MFS family permease
MIEARLGARGRTVAVIAAGAAATLLLGLLPGPAALLIIASVLAGAVRGVFTLTEATLVADYWGPERYAVVNGVFNAPLVAAGALAPSAGAAIAAATGSYPALFIILAGAAAAGAGLAAAAPRPGVIRRGGQPAGSGGERPGGDGSGRGGQAGREAPDAVG